MRIGVASVIVRTTVNIDDPVLAELRRLQKKENKSLGEVVSELLAEAIARRSARSSARPKLEWTSRAMEARVDLDDKEAIQRILEDGEP